MSRFNTKSKELTINEKIQKGKDFEEYTGSLFPADFDVTERAPDVFKSNIKGSYIKNVQNPDFILTHKKTREQFAIECKYRSSFGTDNNITYIEWARPEQITRYKDFEKNRKIPVFIVIGIGGTPKSPEFMFCIPLEDIKYPRIFESIFEKFERIPKKSFLYRNRILF